MGGFASASGGLDAIFLIRLQENSTCKHMCHDKKGLYTSQLSEFPITLSMKGETSDYSLRNLMIEVNTTRGIMDRQIKNI